MPAKPDSRCRLRRIQNSKHTAQGIHRTVIMLIDLQPGGSLQKGTGSLHTPILNFEF
jgi:hypothetical protein